MRHDLRLNEKRIIEIWDRGSGAFRPANFFDIVYAKEGLKPSTDQDREICDRRITIGSDGGFLLLSDADGRGT